MNTNLITALLLTALLAGTVSLAQAAPNFSGTWVMDGAVSDFGMFPVPEKYVREITHNEPNLKIVTTQSSQQGERSSEVNCTTDGTECINTVRGREIKGTAKWDGDHMLVSSKLNYQGDEVSIEETWALSEDGKTLTLDVQLGNSMGSTEMKIILNKQ